MGVSRTVLKCRSVDLELSVDVEKNSEGELAYTISMGSGFGGNNKASVNIETTRMSREDYIVVLAQMQDVLKVTPND